jgi:hypothetical protein
MTMPEPTFETRLRARIHDVLDSQDGPDPVWAEAPAAKLTSSARRSDRWPIRVLGIAALFAIGGGALSVVGSWRPEPAEPTRQPVLSAPRIPDVLRGQFVAQLAGDPRSSNPYPFYFIDLEDSVLLHGPGTSEDPATLRAERGTAAGWAGQVVEFASTSPGVATVVIEAPPPCGEGRYIVRYNETERIGDARPWTLSFTDPLDGCAARRAILAGGSDAPGIPVSASPDGSTEPGPGRVWRTWNHQPALLSGERYSSWSFTEPFHFTVPDTAGGPWAPPVAATPWLAPGRLQLGNVWWRGDFYDDVALPLCDHAIADIPSTPAAFESWLRETGRSIDAAVPITVDGRIAMRYDASEAGSDCPGKQGERFFGRWYLIPTGDDTILFNVYGDTETEMQLADDIVRSVKFD